MKRRVLIVMLAFCIMVALTACAGGGGAPELDGRYICSVTDISNTYGVSELRFANDRAIIVSWNGKEFNGTYEDKYENGSGYGNFTVDLGDAMADGNYTIEFLRFHPDELKDPNHIADEEILVNVYKDGHLSESVFFHRDNSPVISSTSGAANPSDTGPGQDMPPSDAEAHREEISDMDIKDFSDLEQFGATLCHLFFAR